MGCGTGEWSTGVAPLSVVIPARDAEAALPATLKTLEAQCGALIGEIVVVDGGSSDGTAEVARRFGAKVVTSAPGRGVQLACGARRTAGSWLLFLHADTRLAPGWVDAVQRFIGDPAHERTAGYFRLALDDDGRAARRLERIVAWRSRVLGLPYGDQGLLISRALYDAVGGFRPLVLMEDVDLVRRIGRRRLAGIDCTAITSADRYRRSGYLARSARNLLCLTLYFLGLPPRLIARFYR